MQSERPPLPPQSSSLGQHFRHLLSKDPHEILVEPRQRERKVKSREGQRPRCPCNNENGNENASLSGMATNRASSTFRDPSKFHLPQPHPYNAQPARCILKGLSLQEPTEIVHLIKYRTLFLTYHIFLKGVSPDSPRFSNHISKTDAYQLKILIAASRIPQNPSFRCRRLFYLKPSAFCLLVKFFCVWYNLARWQNRDKSVPEMT